MRPYAFVQLTAVSAALLLVWGCSTFRSNENGSMPSAVFQPAVRRGYGPAAGHLPGTSETVLLCRRVMTVPGARMMAACGFYHEWIYTPDREAGRGFVGAEETGYAGLPRPLSNVFWPMCVMDHSGAVYAQGVLVKPVSGLDSLKLVEEMTERGHPGYFPISNCSNYITHALAAARHGTQEKAPGSIPGAFPP